MRKERISMCTAFRGTRVPHEVRMFFCKTAERWLTKHSFLSATTSSGKCSAEMPSSSLLVDVTRESGRAESLRDLHLGRERIERRAWKCTRSRETGALHFRASSCSLHQYSSFTQYRLSKRTWLYLLPTLASPTSTSLSCPSHPPTTSSRTHIAGSTPDSPTPRL